MRCPNGTRKNKKTGNCEGKSSNSPKPKLFFSPKATKRCPKGTKKDKKTGDCIASTTSSTWQIIGVDIVYPSYHYDDDDDYTPNFNKYPIAIENVMLNHDQKVAQISMDGLVTIGNVINGKPNFSHFVDYKSLKEAKIGKISKTVANVKWLATENDDDGNHSTEDNFDYVKSGDYGKPIFIKVDGVIKTDDNLNTPMKNQILEKVHTLLKELAK
jgi:hypothetical protein